MGSRAELWIATKKGVFRASGPPGGAGWSLAGPWLAGYEVYHVAPDPDDTSGAVALTNHPVWGQHVFRTSTAGRSWEMAPVPAFPPGSGHRLGTLWHLAAGPGPARRWYLGVDPGALFVADDPGAPWTWVRGLEEHPTRALWRAAKGGLALHSIQIDPTDRDRLYVAVSAGGCYRSDDGGSSWVPINVGIRAAYLPSPDGPAGHNPHALRLHPARPERLYRQDHCGVYRTDDGGDNWVEITAGLPSDFGYVVALDPGDADRAWVIPEESSHMRCVCDGMLRVFETRDAGGTWVPRTEGLPQRNAYVSVLRDGLATNAAGVFLGTSTGQVYSSADGASWARIPGDLPPVLAVAPRSSPTGWT
jgi:hypothetical protein